MTHDASTPPSIVWQRIALGADRHRYWFLLCLSALFFATAVIRARATPLWHDEVYTALCPGFRRFAMSGTQRATARI
jgi:hypothetical protein